MPHRLIKSLGHPTMMDNWPPFLEPSPLLADLGAFIVEDSLRDHQVAKIDTVIRVWESSGYAYQYRPRRPDSMKSGSGFALCIFRTHSHIHDCNSVLTAVVAWHGGEVFASSRAGEPEVTDGGVEFIFQRDDDKKIDGWSAWH
jgi:hypothetical protein